MPYNAILASEINVGDAITESLMAKIKNNQDYFNSILAGISTALQNGSFEVDADKDDSPDTWTVSTYTGGRAGLARSEVIGTDALNYTCILDHTAAAANKPITGGSYATYWEQKGADGVTWVTDKHYKGTQAPADGRRGLWFEHPGVASQGGGYADSDYTACSPYLMRVLSFIHWCSNAAMKNQVYVRFYDKDKVYISEQQLYSSTANPTTPNPFYRVFFPPATAQFFKTRLIGGYTDTTQAGTAYFDAVSLSADLPDSQVLRDLVPSLADPTTGVGGWTTNVSGSGNAVNYGGHSAALVGSSSGIGGNWFSRAKVTYAIPTLVAAPKKLRFDVVITNMTSLNEFAGFKLYVTQEDPASRASDTAHHFGFKANSAADIYASNANGSTEQYLDTGVNLGTGAQFTILTAILIPGVCVQYYINGLLVATHINNLPGDGDYRVILELDNNDDVSGTMTVLLPTLTRQK